MSSSQSPSGDSVKTYSNYSRYSSSSTNKTVKRNGQPTETVSESVESSSSSANGKPVTFGKFNDNFEDLKRSILSGDAYKRHQRIHKETTPTHGQQRYKPQEGVTTIRPIRAQQTSASPSPITTTPPSKPETVNNNDLVDSPIKMNSHNFKTELYIPVRRHHADFDDFFKSRWLEHNNSLMDSEFDHRRRDWETRLDDTKRDFFHFSSSSDHHPHIESVSTVKPGPTGNPEFAVGFDVKDFKPEEINVSTKSGKLTISAAHEEKSGNSTSRREFKRTVDIPNDVQIGLMRSTLSKDGILSIHAPIKPPNYLPGAPATHALQSSSQVTQQHANALSTMPASSSVITKQSDAGDALNYSLSIVGYEPQEVSVTVEGRKVIIHAKHDESSSGRKVHNEMTKSFDLPPSVDPHHVRSYIKDGSTLFIEAHLRDDMAGKIHLVPVTHKR